MADLRDETATKKPLTKQTTVKDELENTTQDQAIEARTVEKTPAELSDADLENVSGGFLDAHGDVCVSVGAGMSTVTTGGSNKNNG